jgi:hypothetical protein
VVVIRERGGNSVPAVFASESAAGSFIRARIAKGTVVHADEAASWDGLHDRYEMKRINHQEAYSFDGACTNQAEEYFSRLRRAEIGIHHHIAGAYLLRYAQESSWREDSRRFLPPSGAQPVTIITHDFIHRPGIQNAHAGYPLEERIQRSLSVRGRWWRNTGQAFLDRALQRGFDILAGQAGKLLCELINPGGTNIHGPPIIIRERQQYAIIGGRDASNSGRYRRSGGATPHPTGLRPATLPTAARGEG